MQSKNPLKTRSAPAGIPEHSEHRGSLLDAVIIYVSAHTLLGKRLCTHQSSRKVSGEPEKKRQKERPSGALTIFNIQHPESHCRWCIGSVLFLMTLDVTGMGSCSADLAGWQVQNLHVGQVPEMPGRHGRMGGEDQVAPERRAGPTVRRRVSEEPRLSLCSRQHLRPRLFGNFVVSEECGTSCNSKSRTRSRFSRPADARVTGCSRPRGSSFPLMVGSFWNLLGCFCYTLC